MNKLPQARLENIVVQNLNGETLIYDLKTNQAFCLNETSAKVFESCDGKTTFDELKKKYQFTDDLIYFALDELEANNLLANYENGHFKNLSRREVIKRVGFASMVALPVIASLSAPTAMSAASNGRQANNSTCTTLDYNGTSTECQSGYCITTSPNDTRRCCVNGVAAMESNQTGSGSISNPAGGVTCANGQTEANKDCCSGQATINCTQNNPNRITYSYTCR